LIGHNPGAKIRVGNSEENRGYEKWKPKGHNPGAKNRVANTEEDRGDEKPNPNRTQSRCQR